MLVDICFGRQVRPTPHSCLSYFFMCLRNWHHFFFAFFTFNSLQITFFVFPLIPLPSLHLQLLPQHRS